MTRAMPQPICGVITQAPTTPALAASIGYVADVNIDGTLYTDMAVPRPVIQQWPTLVRPFTPGTGIMGVMVNGVAQWHFRELPDLGPCNGDGGGPGVPTSPGVPIPGDGETPIDSGIVRPVRPMRSMVATLLANATATELRALKKALESV